MNRVQRYSPIMTVLIGGLILFIDVYTLKNMDLDQLPIFLLLVFLIWVCEHFYIPIDSYGFSFILPIIFEMGIGWGLPITTIVLGMVTLADGLSFKRWQMKLPIYPFQLVIAFTASMFLTSEVKRLVLINWDLPKGEFLWSLIFTVGFFLVKRVLVFLSKENERQVKKQAGWYALIFILSAFYCWLGLVVSHQDRGKIDSLAYFLFYSPIVAGSLLASVISRLQREKHRMNSVFNLTTLVNSGITAEDPIYEVVTELRKLMIIDASVLWLNENGKWDVFHRDGRVQEDLALTPELILDFSQRQQVIETKKNEGVARFFKKGIQTSIFAPLRVEGELIGMWAVGSQTPNAYSKSDFQTFVTLTHQVAAIARTRQLVREKEKDRIYEERNRIAREFHDGIGQTIAGAVLHLQGFEKLHQIDPDKARVLVNSSLDKLRTSLKQVRSSIYALRPHQSQEMGLIQAIQDRIVIFQEENPDIHVRVAIRGNEGSLGMHNDNAIFDIFKEALRNIEKHSKATKVTVFIGYLETIFCLFVKDNGIGFSLGESLFRAKSKQNFGILNMNELADQLNGSLNIKSRKGKGTNVIITVPYSTEKGA